MEKIIFKTILGKLILLLLAMQGLFAQDLYNYDKEDERKYREQIGASDLSPQSQEPSAYQLILYGQQIPAPYQVEIRNDTLYVNGIQADPPIPSPWISQEIPEITPEIQEMSDLNNRIRLELARLESGESSQEKVQAELIAHIMTHESLVKHVEWSTEDRIHIVLHSETEYSIMVHQDIPTQAELDEVRNEILNELQSNYQAALGSGSMLVIGYGVTLTIPPAYVEEVQFDLLNATQNGSPSLLLEILQNRELALEYEFINFK